jgi:broad specificity phosphatase PhoE
VEPRRAAHGWNLWRDGCPRGESAVDVAARVDPLVGELKGSEADVAVFAHGHLLRVLAARWIELAPEAGARLWLATATMSVLGFERETPAIRRRNAPVR